MKCIVLFISGFIYSMGLFAQAPSNKMNITYDDYKLLKEFLLSGKNDPGFFDRKIKGQQAQKNNPLFFFVQTKNYWSAELSNNLYGRLRLDWKKEFAPPLRFDTRFVGQSIPASYGSQNYQWVPAPDTKYNLGSDIVGSVIGSFLGIKTNSQQNHGYYTPSGIKY